MGRERLKIAAKWEKSMARPEGFEPPTQGLELPGSVQAELRARLCPLKNFSTSSPERSGGTRILFPVKLAEVKTCLPICR